MTRTAACIASALLLAWEVLAAGPAVASVNGHAAGGTGASQGPAIDAKQPAMLDVADLKRRLSQKGMSFGSPMMIRIFKDEAELELWVSKGDRFELFAVYPICNWSGSLGPKLTEGDRQSPEGLYSIGYRQLHRSGRWKRSLDIGFPNTFDKAHGRTGSYILLHGGCTSTGCYAMTNPVMEEIFTLSEAALEEGQDRIQVHVFPFRMTAQKLAAHAQSSWSGFWLGLKEAHDLFERTRVPPRVSVCNNKYVIGETSAPDAGDCAANVSEVSVASARLRHVRAHSRTRRARVARRTAQVRHARRSVGRNVRQAYAAARAARVAAHSNASHLGGPKRTRR